MVSARRDQSIYFISVDRTSRVIFSSDWSFIVIFAIFNILGGYLSNASFMCGPKRVSLRFQYREFETSSDFSFP